MNVLQLKNDFLIKENNSLKQKIREMIYISKLYEQQEAERQKKYFSYLSQLLKENSYLRQSNLSLFGISSTLEFNKSLFDSHQRSYYNNIIYHLMSIAHFSQQQQKTSIHFTSV